MATNPSYQTVQSRPTAPSSTGSKKSMGVAYALWFFLGGLGAHRFYLGKTGSAVGMLVLAFASVLLTFVLVGVFGFIALSIWIIVDAFLIPGWVNSYR